MKLYSIIQKRAVFGSMRPTKNNQGNRIKTLCATVALGGLAFTMSAQEEPIDSLEGEKVVLDEVLVQSVRITKDFPITFSDLDKVELAPRNLGQDIPILMNFMPAVVTTSDAGAGVGYTSMRVRGSDATRVNVTINGIPYNDAESHGTFWVNMPDFASSTQSLQLQRGVGTSTNGAGAFGASLNMLTDAFSEESYATISSSVGSFNTLRNNVKFSTGLMNDYFEFSGRLSRVTSDGYVDRAASELDGYFLQGAYKDDNTLIKALLFGGHEVTYQAWNGITAEQLEDNRTYNSAGEYTDDGGNTQYYENEVDNYKQDHFQLHWYETWNSAWNTHLAVHYTRGRGFFEQFREDDDFATYGLEPITVNGDLVETTDLIRRRWLDNDFYGTIFSATYNNENLELIMGGGYNEYKGDHFGEIIWAEYASGSEIRDRYYDDNSTKTDFNVYTKANYKLTDQWSLFGDVQYRGVTYEANGEDTGLVDDSFSFFNPKAGVTFDLNRNNNFYFSYARANREPNRNDYESGSPKPEKLNDFELGWRYISPSFQLNTNVYYMRYKDQLVLTGELNDVGAPLRSNVGDSYRLGLEIDASIRLSNAFQWRPNIALSDNRNIDFFFERDGELQNLGNTNIAYSPQLIAGNIISYQPNANFQVSLLSKFVGKQYMGNIDSETSVLDGYTQTDFNVQYTININSFVESIGISGLVNNIFDADIVSNGYFYTFDDDYSNPGTITTIEGAGYYPQAGINFLVGATVNF
ncbi:TonB-dependent receptor [Flagellimonas halotolerans]|uniref:TonB-dependent receptor n=1 Tax=Flagellimonas halotolerans TaxID=3112164 RepID=A0ABU6IP90_9FLAO|nr:MULTISPECIES: TonB-dependent receptor [unclassified Allomuricauda]MEC3964823.1 TonB-dependent receptor [Muricauda sp. SYSU M86414]MEC4264813.1 TonB-dependent receptor [Muricauda sp. SYSU M84420]